MIAVAMEMCSLPGSLPVLQPTLGQESHDCGCYGDVLTSGLTSGLAAHTGQWAMINGSRSLVWTVIQQE